ncbi:Hypothetical_protein [Hexamita inflata]|uniref:Hypothetical_protein n=1 Tax=Hexamita inflata TaxID=28002 RepID=A0AA86UBK8_9EUKA|nr:Hypothetical protein HINF_LOCUS23448 [Hexamita inflata]
MKLINCKLPKFTQGRILLPAYVYQRLKHSGHARGPTARFFIIAVFPPLCYLESRVIKQKTSIGPINNESLFLYGRQNPDYTLHVPFQLKTTGQRSMPPRIQTTFIIERNSVAEF